MYFLKNYNDLINGYKKAAANDPTIIDADLEAFDKDMKDLYTYLQDLQNKRTVNSEEVKTLAAKYYHIFHQYVKTIEAGQDYHGTEKAMAEELVTITYLDTSKNDTLDHLMDSAAKPDLFLSVPASPHNRYLADSSVFEYAGPLDLKDRDLEDDQRFINRFMIQLKDAKKHVWGSSPQFERMEKALQETKTLIDELNTGKSTDAASLAKYKQSLTNLQEKARAYYNYKTNNGDRARIRSLKTKETRRVDFSSNLISFSGSRTYQIVLNEQQSVRAKYMKDRENAFTAKMNSETRKKSYAEHMRDMCRDADQFKNCYDKNGAFSAEKLLTIKNKVSGEPAAGLKVYEHYLSQIVKGLFSQHLNIPDQARIREQFLKTGNITEEAVSNVQPLVDQLKQVNKNAYRAARGYALYQMMQQLSSATELKGNYRFVAGLIKTLANDPKEGIASLPEDMQFMVKGVQKTAEIAASGMNAWKTLHKLTEGSPADHEKEILDFITMRTLEQEMKHYNTCTKVKSYMNPVFKAFGMNKGSVEILQKNIRNTDEFKKLMNGSLEDIVSLTNKTDAKAGKLLENITSKAYPETIKACMAVQQDPAECKPAATAEFAAVM